MKLTELLDKLEREGVSQGDVDFVVAALRDAIAIMQIHESVGSSGAHRWLAKYNSED